VPAVSQKLHLSSCPDLRRRVYRTEAAAVVMLLIGASRMVSILPFIRPHGEFDDHVTRIMGEAFDLACADLHDTDQPTIVREVIALRIIEAAKKGERDPIRLRDIGLTALPSD
jgi:hypothetical protein